MLALLLLSAPIDEAPQVEPDARERACIAEHGEDNDAAVLECLGIPDPYSMPIDDLRAGIAGRHPSEMLILASRYFYQEGEKAEGLFWFYAGQLRWRARLACHDFPPGGEGAAAGALFYTIGPDLNEWAGENVDVWLATIDAVHEWDLATTIQYREDAGCSEEFVEQRAGMLDFKDTIVARRPEIEAAAAERIAKRETDAE